MKPRQVLPNTTYLVTRRCLLRQFLLLPIPKIQNCFRYCIGYAALRFGVLIHAMCVMSNHFHLVCTDVRGEMPDFMQWLDCMLARSLNRYHGRRGIFWEGGSYNRVEPIDPEDVLDKMVYTVVNPVAAGLVSRAEDWPGVCSGTLEQGCEVFHATKPEFFFDPDNHELPPAVQVVVEPPEAFERLPEGISYHQVVQQREEQIRAEFQEEGRAFLGKEQVLRQQPTDSPSTEEPRGKLRPQIACKNKERRVEVLRALVAWLQAYKDALREFAQGVRDVVFPPGTFKMRVQFGVVCEQLEPELEPG